MKHTNGWRLTNQQDQKASHAAGRAGEYMAMARLSLAGHTATLAQAALHDAYIQTDTQKLLTLQVKTATYRRFHCYQFYTKMVDVRNRSDIYAFVSIDLENDFEKIFWCRGDDPIIRPSSTHIRFEDFSEKTMAKVLSSFD